MTAGNDYTSLSGFVTITDDVTFQCISVLIQSDSSSEQDTECFTFRISVADTVSGLSVDPAQASVCIIDQGGKYVNINNNHIHKHDSLQMEESLHTFTDFMAIELFVC